MFSDGCHGALVGVVEGATGEPLAVGRRTRAVPPAARSVWRRSTRRAACRSTPAPRVAAGGASVWTTTSPSMPCAGRRAILDGPNRRARTTIRIEPLPANQVSVKKYLPVFAVLVLAGCVHSEYRATFLEEFAGYDCYQLRTERLAAEAELGPKWVKGLAAEPRQVAGPGTIGTDQGLPPGSERSASAP